MDPKERLECLEGLLASLRTSDFSSEEEDAALAWAIKSIKGVMEL